MKADIVIKEVEQFRQNTALGNSPADCFPAWYLHHTFHLNRDHAIQCSSDPGELGTPGYDFGIDAFHYDQPQNRLILIQAKYSSERSYIKKGYVEFKKAIPVLKNLFAGTEIDTYIKNKVITNLYILLKKIDEDTKKNIELEFRLIHLSVDEEDIINNTLSSKREELKETLENDFPDLACIITQCGPQNMGPFAEIKPKQEWIDIRMEGFLTEIKNRNQTNSMYLGLGYLSDLVELYIQRRDALFSKNVRYFIKSKKNIEKGPAAKIRETLKSICVEQKAEVNPTLFALYHNGVTLFARELQISEKTVQVREPYVLNGCQTIKSSYLFRYDSKLKDRVNKELWLNVRIPLRIVTTKDEDLIRLVTINNNRQNSISYAALKANDPIQIQLEDRFRKRGIVYERQEGTFDYLEDTNPELLYTIYQNTYGRRVNIVELARSLAAASGELSFAHSPSHIFESDNAYNRIFSERRLKSMIFLTFLQNLHDILPRILKKDIGLEQQETGPKPSRLTYFTLALLIKYIETTEDLNLIIELGGGLWSSRKTSRRSISTVLDNRHSKIKNLLKEHFLSLDDSKDESLMDAYRIAENKISKSKHTDIFDLIKNLDNEVEYDEEIDNKYNNFENTETY